MARRNFIDPFGQLLNGYREGEKDYYDNILRRLQIAEKGARAKAGQPAADELRNVNLQIAKERLATARMNRAEKQREIDNSSRVPLGYGGGSEDAGATASNPRVSSDVRTGPAAAPATPAREAVQDDAAAQARRDAARLRSEAKRGYRLRSDIPDPLIDDTGGAGLGKVSFNDTTDEEDQRIAAFDDLLYGDAA
jgi:hypothetical protein